MEKLERQNGSFILYASQWEAIKGLSINGKAEILDAIFTHQTTGTAPNIMDVEAKMAFIFIKHQMDLDNEKYKAILERNAIRSAQKTNDRNKNPQYNDNDNDNDNDNKDINVDSTLNSVERFVAEFNAIRKSRFRSPDKIKRQFNARIREGYTIENMLQALRGAMKSQYHIDSRMRYLTPEFFTRPDKIELYMPSGQEAETPVDANGNPVKLGPGEWMDNGERYYGTAHRAYPAPLTAPPRPDIDHYYDPEKGEWTI